MRKTYYKCLDCENIMSESETGSAVGENKPKWEKIMVCSNCGSDELEEVGQCDVCGEYFEGTWGTPDELYGFNGCVCGECLKKFVDIQVAIKYGDKDKSSMEISEFFWRLFDKDEIHDILLNKAMDKFGSLYWEAVNFCLDDQDDFSDWLLANGYYEEGE